MNRYLACRLVALSFYIGLATIIAGVLFGCDKNAPSAPSVVTPLPIPAENAPRLPDCATSPVKSWVCLTFSDSRWHLKTHKGLSEVDDVMAAWPERGASGRIWYAVPQSFVDDLPPRIWDHQPRNGECSTEDSKACFWDAKNRGNKKGRPFWTDDNDTVHYI
jgi:hypothetical protein